MEKCDIFVKAKEILNKLLEDKLNVRISNLESNYQKELAVLSTLSSSSKNIINNLSKYTSPKPKETILKKSLKIPKLNLDEVYQNSTIKKEEEFIEIDSILKNKKHKNGRNKEIPISTIYNKDKSKTRVSFWNKEFEKSNKKETPDIKTRKKPFMTITYNNSNKTDNKLNKTFIKIDSNLNKKKKQAKHMKCLTERLDKDTLKTPLRLNLAKKICKNNNINNTLLIMPPSAKKIKNFKKNLNKTTVNFFQKNSEKEKGAIPIFLLHSNNRSKNSKTPEKKRVENEIKKHEKNLKSLCESMLVDVYKDELLVNDTKYLNEFDLNKKISFNDEENYFNNNKKLEDNFKICIQYFIDFLTINEIFKLCKTKKEILKTIINLKINKTEKSIDNINTALKKYNLNNKDFMLPKKLKPFELNQKSQKAITLLNSLSKINFIKSIKSSNNIIMNKNKNMKKILLIFEIYFISIGKKNILNNLNSDSNKKIEYICNYFKNNKNKLLGSIIENDLKNKKFDDFILNNIYECSKEYIDNINPNYYKKINKDIAIFVFIIKNILDFVGVSCINLDNKENEQNIAFLQKSRLNVKNIILDKLNKILNKFN